MSVKILKPFEEVHTSVATMIQSGWVIAFVLYWLSCSLIGTTHLFPTITQTFSGLAQLYNEGLVVHVANTMALFSKSILYAIIISLIFCYLSPIPILKPLATVVSKLRYLPPVGLSYYISVMIQDARSIQVWVLVIFVCTFLITSILSVIKDIPPEEHDHARTLGCNRWERLWEVVIKGRFDYIIEAIRINLAIVWVSIVTIESIVIACGGLGVLIKNSDKGGNLGRVVAIQLIIILFGLGIDFVLTQGRKLAFRYSKF